VPTPPNASQQPNLKRIYRIDLEKNNPTDVSKIATLPITGAELAGLSITPVSKTLFLDLLDPSYKVNATQTIRDVIAEKVEGMAWGPDLPDGRHVLYIVTDNDLFPGLPTQIYGFAIDAAAADIDYRPQELPGPLFPPGQVKKVLR
jgi:Esterase-like activity of phytase